MKANRLSQLLSRQKIVLFARNLKSGGFLWAFLLMLPYRLLLGWKSGKNAYVALWKSLVILPRALFKRMNDETVILNDTEVSKLMGKRYVR